ncbi:hypothetical protein NKH48_19290 [Mesorhizobium sp. M1233]|uniref:hypothetical protein n=1 Tax=Mesorhizobium sp. M1233 TaxID=2957072 RepID=UPI0033357B7F
MKTICFLLLVRLFDGSPEQTIEVNTFGPMTFEQCKADRDDKTKNGYPMAPEVDGHNMLKAFWKLVWKQVDLLQSQTSP